SEEGKVPITTTSEEAREYYLQGRDLFEKLRAQESLQFFENAVGEDSEFAMGYLFLSLAQPTTKGFFEKLNKAVALAAKVSEGERLWILGVEAGVNGFAMRQREYYQKLVAAYPKDERAHNLLGNVYFGQQEYKLAIEEYLKATEIAPDFSQPYNQLGYAHRFLGNYSGAERAFKKYIQLIPDDPNPYDSYAELLMKMGKCDKSIEYYQKALSVDPNFVASHVGIATNLNCKGDHQDARKQLQKLYDMARNDGERRAAHFATAVSYVDEGDMDRALEELNKQYALAEKINDASSMAGDMALMGNILLETGRFDEALAKYNKAVKIIEESDLSEEVKDNTRRGYLFNTARVALKNKDFATAKAKSEEYRKQVKAINNPFQIRLSHELAGMIALEEKNYDKALEELQQANQQNPYNLYRMALAYEGKGDKQKAKELCMTAANFNALNSLNYAFMRKKAQQMVDLM
ncbi:MAG: tetratricopeptide repeat protein, partial [Candidatus Zixiibacteriota bacterium]